jgi:transcriptional regulator GlxA family with amidase domain
MRRIGLIIFPGFQALDLAAATVFEVANRLQAQPAYAVSVMSAGGGLIPSSIGVGVDSVPFEAEGFDTILVCGSMGVIEPAPGLLDCLRAARARARRTASICTGAFFLAQAGLLDGVRATTHWAYARDLQRRYPAVRVEEDRIFIADGGIWTSAGMTACIDLALAMVEADLGAITARAVAKRLVVYHLRSGGQSQFSAMLELTPTSDRIGQALAHARAHLRDSLSVEELAQRVGLSPRQFSRAFRAETGQSPAKAVEALRVEAARAMIEAGRLSNETVAREVGFGDPDRMRRAFLRTFGQTPQTIRRTGRQVA